MTEAEIKISACAARLHKRADRAVGIGDATLITVAFAAHVAATSVCCLSDDRDEAIEYLKRFFAVHASRERSRALNA
jgi:hypothetical protein